MADNKLLLVEGPDDERVVTQLCKKRGIADFVIESCGGIDIVLERFPVELKRSNINVLGVVVDADADLSARWEALRNHLKEYSAVPKQPLSDGLILDAPANTLLPRVGVWIMPNNQTNGILEDFLRDLVPQGSRLFEHVKTSVDAIPEDEVRFTSLAKPKAIMHTWLAWQEEPGKPLGLAIAAKYLDPNSAKADPFVFWLNRLYFQTEA